MGLGWQGIVVLVDLLISLLIMGFEKGPADLVMLTSVIVLLPLGVISTSDVLAGFSNSGLATVMILFVIAFAIEKTGCLDVVVKILQTGQKKGRADGKSLGLLFYKLGVPIGLLSAFLNNTPIVAMFIPVLADFAKSAQISPSKVMIPLSYFTILGGTITKIGTSTNLVVYALANKSRPAEVNEDTFGLFALAIVGLPTFLAGMLYVSILGTTKMLPSRVAPSVSVESTREYIVTTVIPKGHPLIGQTLQKLRRLRDLFLCQILRNFEDGSPAKIIPAPPSTEILREGDTLYFAGSAEKFVLLREFGLELQEGEQRNVDLARLGAESVLYEAVISPHSSYISHSVSVKELEFRTKFGAAILAVHRHGERLQEPIGDIKLQAHDIVLLLGSGEFQEKHFHDHANFTVVRRLNQVPPKRKLWQAVLTALCLIVPITLSNISINVPGGKPLDFNTLLFLGAVVIVLFGCITPREARGSLSWEVFILVAMSFALGTAMEKSGAAQWIADGLLAATKNMGGLLVAAYFVTVVLNAILTNNAAVAVVWPIIDAALRQTGYPVIPFLLALCMAGSADFATPIGYQTNLMVWAPGGYRFIDYTLFGGPLQLIVALVTIPICLWENTWLIWTGVLGLANVIVFIIFLALNWQKLGDTLGITKRFGGETHVHSDIENVRGGSLDEPEDEEVNGADNVSPISKRSSYSNASDTVVPLPIDSSIEVGSAKDVYLK